MHCSSSRACLEKVLQTKLHLAIAGDGGADSPERGAAERTRRRAELRRVQKIKCFPAKLHAMSFFNVEFLEQREIPSLLTGRVEEVDSRCSISERANKDTFTGTSIAL